MFKIRNISFKVKVILVLLIVIATAFGIWNFVWYNYNKTFDYFVDVLLETGECEQSVVLGTKIYRFHDNDNYCTYSISRPKYLEFTGDIQILTQTAVDCIDGQWVNLIPYDVTFDYRPAQKILLLGIGDVPETMGDTINILVSTVDVNGVPAGKAPGDTEDFYRQWLVLYNKHYDDIYRMLGMFKDMFGEDMFNVIV